VIAEGRGKQFEPDLVDLFLSPPVIDAIEDSISATKSRCVSTAGATEKKSASLCPTSGFDGGQDAPCGFFGIARRKDSGNQRNTDGARVDCLLRIFRCNAADCYGGNLDLRLEPRKTLGAQCLTRIGLLTRS
jgi:hypothetical protein